MNDKWDVPAFQCKMSLNRSTAMREIDDLCFILIEFHVPMLKPWIHWSEAALKISENITLYAVCGIYTCHQQKGLGGLLQFLGNPRILQL